MIRRRNSTAWTALVVLSIAGAAGCSRSPQRSEARFLKRAQQLRAGKDYGRALLELRNAARVSPQDAEPLYRIGLVYLESGNLPAAAVAFRKATELNPNHEGAQLQLARLMTLGGNKDLAAEAEKRLLRILSTNPENADAADTLAKADIELGKAEEGARRLQEILEKFPSRLQSSVNLALLQLSQANWKAAEETLRKAVNSAPDSWEAALALGSFYADFDRFDMAERELQRAAGLCANDPGVLAALASLEVRTNRGAEAEKLYRRISVLPASPYRMLYGAYLYQSGRAQEAVREFERLAKLDPRDRAARTRLLAVYLDLNRTAEANRILDAALRQNPKDADALLQKGEIAIRSGELAEAERDLNTALQFQPDSTDVHVALALLYQSQGAIARERQELGEVLRLNPSHLGARLTLARSYLARNEGTSAVQLLTEAPPAQKEAYPVVVEMHWALLMTGRKEEARNSIAAALKRGRTPDLLVQQGTLHQLNHEFEAAHRDAGEALKLNAEDLRAARLLADSRAAANQPSAGLAELRAHAAAHPRSAALQHLLGQYLLHAGRRAEGRKAFTDALAADSKFLPAAIGLADLDMTDGNLAAARQRLDAALAVDPRNVAALLQRARLAELSKDTAGAQAAYRAVLGVSPSNVAALNNLAYLLAKDSSDEALRLQQEALALQPDDATLQDTMGWIYYRKGIYRMAVDYLERAAKTPSPRYQYHLGMAYLKAGDLDRGRPLVEASLRKDPRLPVSEPGW